MGRGTKGCGLYDLSIVVSVECEMLTIEEKTSGLGVTGNALQQGQGIANPIRSMGCETGRRKGRINVDDLEEQRRHDTFGKRDKLQVSPS
jgi:hypothetical protein